MHLNSLMNSIHSTIRHFIKFIHHSNICVAAVSASLHSLERSRKSNNKMMKNL